MSDFETDLDIANRALQHVGARRIGSMTEASKEANEVNFCYDKLRLAELRRNVWRFAIRKTALRPLDTATMRIIPPDFDDTGATNYIPGAIVVYAGDWWQCVRSTTGIPDTTGEYWVRYFGAQTASPYDSGTAYFAGELVYTPQSGSYRVYMSTANNNSDDPTTAADYNSATIYKLWDSVTYSAVVYQSNDILNIGNTPDAGDPWETIPTGQFGAMVGQKWIDLGSLAAVPDGYDGYPGVTLENLILQWPLGTGPASDSSTRNVYCLPYNFLREAPQDPKLGSHSYLGAPSGMDYSDWNPSSDFFTSLDNGVILFRFVADVSDVPHMDALFCEGLAARIGLEVCETLTQSDSKLSNIASQYQRFMGEARIINGIETGPTEPPEDDYITCRR